MFLALLAFLKKADNKSQSLFKVLCLTANADCHINLAAQVAKISESAEGKIVSSRKAKLFDLYLSRERRRDKVNNNNYSTRLVLSMS